MSASANALTKHLCIDIDNVVGQSDTLMREAITEYTEGRVNLKYEDVKSFNYYECVDSSGNGITRDEWKGVHLLFSEPRFLLRIAPHEGAIDALRVLTRAFRVHLVTARLPSARKTTVEWLDSLGLGTLDLHFLSYGEKHSCLKNFRAAVEDDYAQAKSFALQGVPSFLLRHPWNDHLPQTDGLVWVSRWGELAPRLTEGAAA